MRHIGEILKEMGFKKDSSLDTQKAFVKNLIKAAQETTPTQSLNTTLGEDKAPQKGDQLSFNLKVS